MDGATYREWLCDGDAYLHGLHDTQGWWSARRDIDAQIVDGRLFIDDEEVRP